MILQVDVEHFYILGVPPYVFFAGVGLVFSFLCFALLLKSRGYEMRKNGINFMISVIGLLIGAKVFGVITNLLVAWNQNEKITISTFLNTGIVFYGGLLGFLFTFIYVNKIQNKTTDYNVIDIVAVCVSLFHFFARIGCFFAGCCYGKIIDTPISIMYKTARLELDLRIPVQLIEASANMLIFIICFTLLKKHILPKRILNIYLFSYASVRFLDEFIRGDTTRGFVGVLSFSQVISLIIFAFLAFQVIKLKHLKKEFGT